MSYNGNSIDVTKFWKRLKHKLWKRKEFIHGQLSLEAYSSPAQHYIPTKLKTRGW